MKTDIKSLLEIAGVDTTQGKAKELVEASTIDGEVQDPKKLVWKQTSLSSEEAAKKWGKENVRIASKKSQGGDDIVEVRTKLGPK